MPTYEYECQDCDERFEIFHPMSEKPRKTCPKCGKDTLKRLLGTGAGIIFKGSGFYCTDYRSNTYSNAKKADASSSAAPAAKTETKTSDAGASSAKTAEKKT